MTWKFVKYIYIEGRGELPACEACGHDIRHQFIIQNEEIGQQMTVGSECVKTWCNPADHRKINIADKRSKRAANQWRKKKPSPKDGEGRGEYINRRVQEFENAWEAAKEWHSMIKTSRSYNGYYTQSKLARLAEEKFLNKNVHRTFHLDYYGRANSYSGHEGKSPYTCPQCKKEKEEEEALLKEKQLLYKEIRQEVLEDIEKRYNANRYDFTRQVWDAKSL